MIYLKVKCVISVPRRNCKCDKNNDFIQQFNTRMQVTQVIFVSSRTKSILVAS